MRVAIVNTGTTGGAATAALRLHHGLRSISVDSRFVCCDSSDEADHIYTASLQRRPIREILLSFVKQRLAIPDRSSAYGLSATPKHTFCELFSDCRSAVGRRRQFPCEPFDVINLHWISQFLDLETVLRTYAGKVPIVWTLHDMNAMTGGCHYDAGCGKFTDNCRECPHLMQPGVADASNSIFRAKERLLSLIQPDDLHFVTPSQWLAESLKQSRLLSRFPVTVISNGVDPDLFRPISRSAAREVLGLSSDGHVILFVAESVSNPRKGFDLLSSALRSMRFEKPTTLLCVGKSKSGLPAIENVKTLQLGSISNALFLPIVYSAADIFVIPSRQDNLPNTVLESLSCGTPVVGFQIGGLPDLIQQGRTGWLAGTVSAESLAQSLSLGLRAVSQGSVDLSLAQSCREYAVAKLTVSRQAENYSSLFSSLLVK